MNITKEDLYKNKYSFDILKANIYAVSLLDILKTQILDAVFCVKYILNPDFQLSEEEENIDMTHVLQFQPHISISQLIDEQLKAKKLRTIKKRIDSIEDFETYMNKHS